MIFYFSGTGNSKYVSQKIAQDLGDRLISVSDCMQKQNFTFTVDDRESIGFIFPTYFYGVPTIIEEFIEKLELKNYDNQYTYSITTCGKECGDLFSQLEKLLFKKGISLNGASEVIFPDNYILLFNLLPKKEKHQAMFIAADNHINALISQIRNRDLPLVKSSLGIYIKTQLMYRIYKYGRRTKHFYTTNACNGCKLCEKICPVDIIVVDSDKPQWKKERCVQCLACLHRCPQKAIQHKNRTEKRERYHNPNIKL